MVFDSGIEIPDSHIYSLNSAPSLPENVHRVKLKNNWQSWLRGCVRRVYPEFRF